MSRKSRERRAKNARMGLLDKLDDTDTMAEQQGRAMAESFTSSTIDFGKRMNRFYWCDGFKFGTGKRHRSSCAGMTTVERKTEYKQNRVSKQRNLLSEAVHKRIANPVLYKQIEIRRIVRLVEYKTGRAV